MEENDRMRQQLTSNQNTRDFENEVDTWKRKFCQLNRDYHILQE